MLICEPNADLRAEVVASLPEEFYEVLSFRDERRARKTLDELEIEVVIAEIDSIPGTSASRSARVLACEAFPWIM